MRNVSRSLKNEFNYKNEVEKNNVSVEGVFRIVIQRNLKEMVDLPEIKIWSVLPRTIQTRMIVRIRRYGFFLTHDLNESIMHCILTRRNYLIIYAKERQLKGYAVKLSLAEKLNISCSRTEKGYCVISLKWQFGEITLTMLKEQAIEWRHRILESFENTTEKNQEASVQTNKSDLPQNNMNVKYDSTFYRPEPNIVPNNLSPVLLNKMNFPKSRSFVEPKKNNCLEKSRQSNCFCSLQTLPPYKTEPIKLKKNNEKIRLNSYIQGYEADLSSNYDNENIFKKKKFNDISKKPNLLNQTPINNINDYNKFFETKGRTFVQKKNPRLSKKPIEKFGPKDFLLANGKSKHESEKLIQNELKQLSTVNEEIGSFTEKTYLFKLNDTNVEDYQSKNLNQKIKANDTFFVNGNKFTPKQNLPLMKEKNLSRSLSSSAVDLNSMNFEFDDKVVIPRRSIGRIERPISNPTDFEACFTVVKRYGFDEPKNTFSTKVLTKFNRSPNLSLEYNNIQEKMEKARELFKERIAKNKLKIQQENDLYSKKIKMQCSTEGESSCSNNVINTSINNKLPKPILRSLRKSKSSSSIGSSSSLKNSSRNKVFFWPLPDNAQFFDANVNANTMNNNLLFRRFFESDA